ncbi:hypothetical protein BG000_004613, partial [Podila horticola]
MVKGLTNLCVISDDVKEGICHGIETSGLQFCQCHTEADLSIQVVLRPMPKTRDFGIYSKDAILQTLHLDSSKHLLLLGTVSDNDYVQNITSLGLVRNVEIVRSVVPAHPHTTLMSYIQKARERVTQEIKNDHFKLSESIFMNLIETALSVAPPTNDIFIGRFAQFLALKDLRSASIYVTPKSHQNQYQPIFCSKESILCGTLYKDISTAKERDQSFVNKLTSQPRPSKPKKIKRKRKKVARTPSAPSTRTINQLYYAYAITIDALLATAPPPIRSNARPAWAPTTGQECKCVFNRLLTVDFARDLARALFNGIKDDPQEDDFELPQGPLDLARLSYFARATSLLPLRPQYPGLQISELSKVAASTVVTAFAEEGDEPQDPTLSAIESYFLRNEARQSFADFPKARFVPGFVYLTQEGLVHALWATETTKALLQTVPRRLGEEDLFFCRDMASLDPVLEGSAPEEPTALEQTSLLRSVVIQPRADGSLDLSPVLETFSTKGRAVDYVQEHKGRLIDALFGCKALDIQDNGAEEDDDDDLDGLEGLDDDDEIDAAFWNWASWSRKRLAQVAVEDKTNSILTLVCQAGWT